MSCWAFSPVQLLRHTEIIHYYSKVFLNVMSPYLFITFQFMVLLQPPPVQISICLTVLLVREPVNVDH